VFDTVITNGTAVVEGQAVAADLAIQGERIAAIATRGTPLPAYHTIDAAGMLVLPGGIDPHVHIRCFNDVADDFATATRSAAFGGYTALGVFVVGRPGDPVGPMLDHFLDEGARTSHADFVLHCVLRPGDAEQVGEAFTRNIRTMKIFMAYLSLGQVMPDDEMVRLMHAVRVHDGLLLVHAENGYLIDHLETQLRRQGKATWEYLLASQPALAEQGTVRPLSSEGRASGWIGRRHLSLRPCGPVDDRRRRDAQCGLQPLERMDRAGEARDDVPARAPGAARWGREGRSGHRPPPPIGSAPRCVSHRRRDAPGHAPRKVSAPCEL
jgi:dihydroorotase-like cyclic amidohydrolase